MKNKLITLFEHETTKNFGWSESDLIAVTKMNSEIGANVLSPVVKFGKKELKAAEYVGVVRFGKRSIQILPKIYRSSSSNSDAQIATQSSRNLLKLLSYAGDFPFKESEVNSLLKMQNDWFEILIHLFSKRLHEEWRTGANRNYQPVDETLPVLKGRWKIASHIKNPIRKTSFDVIYDEFTVDNPLNRLFRFVVEKLLRLTGNLNNKQTLSELKSFMEDVQLVPHISKSEIDSINLTRMNARYEMLLNLAKLFLENRSIQMAHGKLDTFSFVFNMNYLFENFIAEFIRRNKKLILNENWQAIDIFPQARGTSRYLATSDNRNYFSLKPDIVFKRKDNNVPLILDTKYKRVGTNLNSLGIAQSDFYQMHAYAHRYNCEKIILLYPQDIDSGKPFRKQFNLTGTAITIETASVNMQINLSSKNDRQNLIEELKEILGELNGN